ncbi:MAG: endolytic transglycosylase MltG, partial [Propioniciclava sp.]
MTETEQGTRIPTEPGRFRDAKTGRLHRRELLHYARGWAAVAVAMTVLIGGLWWGGGKAWDAWMTFRTQDDYVGPGGEEVIISIPRGASMSGIGDLLEEADVIKSTDTFVKVVRRRPEEAAKVQAGSYRMLTQMPAEAAFLRLIDPDFQVLNQLQIPEGLRLTAEIEAISAETGIPVDELNAALKDVDALELPAWSNGNPEGFLFPDTYQLPTDPSALEVLQLSTRHFNSVIKDIDFEDRAEESPAGDAYQALIMASLLEREAKTDEDRRKVARVFYNRMEQGMPLQSDATVA